MSGQDCGAEGLAGLDLRHPPIPRQHSPGAGGQPVAREGLCSEQAWPLAVAGVHVAKHPAKAGPWEVGLERREIQGPR